MKKYVITRGTGFIGSHIAEYLTGVGLEAIASNSLRKGFEKYLKGLNVKFIKGYIRDKDLVNNISVIFNLAALVSVPESLLQIKECIDINILGTKNILESVKKNANCKEILSSSVSNYGNNPILPKVEAMTRETMTPLAITKLDGESYLKKYQYQWNVPMTSLCYFNVFGPRQSPQSAYAVETLIFINKDITNKSLTIYGGGLQTRNFVYVKDLVKPNILASKIGNCIYNVALGYSKSILELAVKIIEITNSQSQLQFLEVRLVDI